MPKLPLLLAAWAVMLTGGSAWAQPTPPSLPTVVEMFTSKYCPNCPAAESKLKKLAAADPNLFVVFAHVDYWDDETHHDPFGLKDLTQRQYDYGNTLGRRPGEVFTPMPILNGRVIANPPLFFNWEGAYADAKRTPIATRLDVKRTPAGGLDITWPAQNAKEEAEVWVLALSPADQTPAWVVRGVTQANISGTMAKVAPALLPRVAGKPAPAYLVLLQQAGPGPIRGMGILR